MKNEVTVKHIEDIEPYSGPGAIPGIRFRAARDAMGVSSWGMNVLELDPGCEGHPQHDHVADGQEELYVVLSGSVVLTWDDQERVLKQGQMARVPAHLQRKLMTRDEGATILALGGKPGAAYSPGIAG